MAFTDRLGASNSQPGNVVFATLGGGGSTFDEPASNTLTLTQSATRTGDFNKELASTLSLTQRVRISRPLYPTNTLSLTQSATYTVRLNTSPASTPAFTQTVNLGHGRTVSQSLSLVSTAVGNLDRDLLVEQELNLVDAALRVIDEDVEHTLILTHDVDSLKLRSVTRTSTLTLTSTLTREVTFDRTAPQGLIFTQLARRNIYKLVSASNTLSLSQSATNTLTKLAANALVLDHDAEYVTGKHVRSTLEITQVAFPSPVYNRALFNNFIPGQVVVLSKTVRYPISQALTLTQSAIGFAVKNTASSLALTQSATCINAKPASNVLFIVQQQVVSKSVAALIESDLGLVSVVSAQVSKAESGTSYLGFNQFARGTVRHDATATSALTLTQDLVRTRTVATLPQALTITQSAVGNKTASPTATSTLTLTHSVTLSKDIVRLITDNLVFLTSYQKPTGIASHPSVDVPNVQVTNSNHRNCIVVLQNGTLTIVLPCPEFSDSEGGTGVINIKRTMGGSRRVYKKESPTSKLNYQFVIDRKKAIELRNFILQSNTAFLRMQNWKGELWAVQMTNSPFNLTEDAAWLGSPGGNRSSVALEFEGVRLN